MEDRISISDSYTRGLNGSVAVEAIALPSVQEWMILAIPPASWVAYTLWTGSRRERLYVVILLFAVGAIFFTFGLLVRSEEMKWGIDPRQTPGEQP